MKIWTLELRLGLKLGFVSLLMTYEILWNPVNFNHITLNLMISHISTGWDTDLMEPLRGLHFIKKNGRSKVCLPCCPGWHWPAWKWAMRPCQLVLPGKLSAVVWFPVRIQHWQRLRAAADCWPPPTGSAWRQCEGECSHSRVKRTVSINESSMTLWFDEQVYECAHTNMLSFLW